MSKISCDICMDLIPLVKDDVASKDSHTAVMEHIRECEACHCVWNEINEEKPKMNEQKVLLKIKKQLYFIALVMIILGTLLGVGLSDSAGLFYNVLIMPAIGGISFAALKRKSCYVPMILFVFVYLWYLIKYFGEGLFAVTTFISTILAPAYWALMYSGLCALGIVIALLLNIAFRKEGKDEKDK